MNIDEILSGAVGASLVAIFGFVKWLIKRHDRRKEYNFERALDRITQVYNIMNTILSVTRGIRVVILRAENSGKVPEVGKDLYSSIVHEVYDDTIKSAYGKWRKQPLDEEYVKMLLDIANNPYVKIKTEDIKSPDLKNLYLLDELACSYVFKLYAKPTQFFYLSVNFLEDVELTPVENDILRISVVRLRKIFDQQEKIRESSNG